MPRKLIKRYLPHHDNIRDHKHLRLLRPLLQDPNILHLNRRSVSGAFAIGLFMAFIPVPFQMWLAAITSIVTRVNLPISIGLVWISNPITMPPMFYFAYIVGTWLMGVPVMDFDFELSWEWLTDSLIEIWQPFLLGCFFVGSIAGAIGFFSIRGLWRLHVQQSWRERREKRLAAKKSNNSNEV